MTVKIYSRKAMEKLLSQGKIENTAVISFTIPSGVGIDTLKITNLLISQVSATV